jgi:Fur family transcriptional regulator, ferric uptake regulator
MRASSVEKIILETLSREHAHLTSLEVYEEIRGRLPAVNPSTVYRALERLVSYGKVSVSDMGTGSAVFELLADGLHHHLVCQKCSRVITLGDEDVCRLFEELERKNAFHITTNHLILFGICEDCQGNEHGEKEDGAVDDSK